MMGERSNADGDGDEGMDMDVYKDKDEDMDDEEDRDDDCKNQSAQWSQWSWWRVDSGQESYYNVRMTGRTGLDHDGAESKVIKTW